MWLFMMMQWTTSTLCISGSIGRFVFFSSGMYSIYGTLKAHLQGQTCQILILAQVNRKKCFFRIYNKMFFSPPPIPIIQVHSLNPGTHAKEQNQRKIRICCHQSEPNDSLKRFLWQFYLFEEFLSEIC